MRQVSHFHPSWGFIWNSTPSSGQFRKFTFGHVESWIRKKNDGRIHVQTWMDCNFFTRSLFFVITPNFRTTSKPGPYSGVDPNSHFHKIWEGDAWVSNQARRPNQTILKVKAPIWNLYLPIPRDKVLDLTSLIVKSKYPSTLLLLPVPHNLHSTTTTFHPGPQRPIWTVSIQ